MGLWRNSRLLPRSDVARRACGTRIRGRADGVGRGRRSCKLPVRPCFSLSSPLRIVRVWRRWSEGARRSPAGTAPRISLGSRLLFPLRAACCFVTVTRGFGLGIFLHVRRGQARNESVENDKLPSPGLPHFLAITFWNLVWNYTRQC